MSLKRKGEDKELRAEPWGTLLVGELVDLEDWMDRTERTIRDIKGKLKAKGERRLDISMKCSTKVTRPEQGLLGPAEEAVSGPRGHSFTRVMRTEARLLG